MPLLDEDAIGPLWKGKRFPAASCISGWCMQHREVVAVPDIYQDSRIPHDAYRPTFVKSLVMVPIRSSDPIGAIGNYWSTSHEATRDEIELLQALADSTAVAMEGAYLRASMQRQIEERTQDSRLARDQAENATAVKSRFLAAASHNLRQPVQALRAVSAVLERLRSDGESRLHLTSMNQAIRNMESMLGTLLDLHRLEAGAIEPDCRDTRLDAILARLRSEFAYLAEEKSLEIEIPQTVPAVYTDASLLQEILRNFISNAIKYTERGEVRLECRESGADILITVADTGPGIPSGQLSRIFEAFYRGPIDSSEAATEGFGLGLSIVEQLARILKHAVTVESTTGVGSRFSIAVPRAHAEVTAERQLPIAAPTAIAASAGRVVYVEDDPGVRNVLKRLLELEGYDVVAFSNGEDVFNAVATGAVTPDIVISDFRLPGGETGPGIVERVRSAAGRRIPALLLTGETGATVPSGLRANSDRILYKPVDAKTLLGQIGELLANASA